MTRAPRANEPRGRRRAPLLLAAAIAAVAALGVALSLTQRPTTPSPSPSASGAPNASGPARESYVIEARVGGGGFETRRIGATGTGCEIFDATKHPRLRAACSLATHIDPRAIVAVAPGGLGEGRTPAFEAIVWRARLDGRSAVCGAAGLTGELLAECDRRATDPFGLAIEGDARVRIAIAGA